MKLRIEVELGEVLPENGPDLVPALIDALRPHLDTSKPGIVTLVRPPESEADKVHEVVRTLNDLIRWTGLTVVGTTTSALSLRIVRATGVSSPGSLGVTVDAAHFQVGPREWLDGADDRRRKDPVWAEQAWGKDGRRTAGNVRLAGEGPRHAEHSVVEFQQFATRKAQDEVAQVVEQANCDHRETRKQDHASGETYSVVCSTCGLVLGYAEYPQ